MAFTVNTENPILKNCVYTVWREFSYVSRVGLGKCDRKKDDTGGMNKESQAKIAGK